MILLKKLITILTFTCSVQVLSAQLSQSGSVQSTIDSLKYELKETQNDTLRLVLINQIRYNYFLKKSNFDSTLVYSKLFLPLAQKLGYKIDEAYAYDLIADILNFQNNQNTLETFFRGLKIAEDPSSENKILPRKYLEKMIYWQPNFTSHLVKNNWSPHYFRLAILESLYTDLANAYGKVMPNQQRLLYYFSKAIEICKAQNNVTDLVLAYTNIAEYFNSTGQLDSCLLYAQKANALQMNFLDKSSQRRTLALIGTVYLKKGNYPLALTALRQSIRISLNYELALNWLAYTSLSEYFLKTGAIDSSVYYTKKAYSATAKLNLPDEMQKTSALLAELYKKTGAKDSALKYFELSLALNDSVNSADKKRKLQSQDFEEQAHQRELQEEKAKIKVYALLGGLGTLLIIAFFLLRNNLQRKKTNTILHLKNREIESTLNELKSTQAQLIQQEKMASLGELTAGIAHEIQNPLNFVNILVK